MKKLNLLNSLIFVLALQSSVSMMAVTREELVASYEAYKKDGKNKQELIAQLDEMIKSVESVTKLNGTRDGAYAQLKKDLGVDIRQLRNNLSSYFTKKNVAIATAATLIAGYEAFKAYQAFTKPESLKSAATAEYFKTFGKKLAELHKQDLNKVTALVKGLGAAAKARIYSLRPEGQIAQPSIFSKARTSLSNLKNSATAKFANAAHSVKESSKNALEKVGTFGTKIYRRINPIKSVNDTSFSTEGLTNSVDWTDTSFSPVGLTNKEYGVVSRNNEAYNLSKQCYPGDLTSRELEIVSRINDAEALSQLSNLALGTSDIAVLDPMQLN